MGWLITSEAMVVQKAGEIDAKTTSGKCHSWLVDYFVLSYLNTSVLVSRSYRASARPPARKVNLHVCHIVRLWLPGRFEIDL
jgi:hypothetical protein